MTGPFKPYSPEDLQSLLQMLAFDSVGYQARYSDLAHLSREVALEHFVNHGWGEGRVPHFALDIAELQRRLRWLSASPEAKCALERMVALCIIKGMDPSFLEWSAIKDLLRPAENYMPFLIIGDSHSHFFEPLVFLKSGVFPVLLLCSGGSARGLANPNAKSANGPRILTVLNQVTQANIGAPIVFKFGQVDIEFVYNFRRVAQQMHAFDLEDAEEYARQTIKRYARFLLQCRTVCPNPIIVSSVFAPTLSDVAIRDGYINAHIGQLHSDSEIKTLTAQLKDLDYPSLTMRTKYNRYFNDLLRRSCLDLGLEYLEEFDAMLDANGTIDATYTSAHRGTDHHICLGEAATQERMAVVANHLASIKPLVR